MELTELLEQSRAEAIDDALEALSRAGLPHYASSSVAQNHERLARLYDLTLACIRTRDLAAMNLYARSLARERQHAGFGLSEVHSAFNVLEEVLWRRVTAQLEPRRYPEALGLVSTVLGAGKHALAVEYVALASGDPGVHSLDLSALFKGTA